jgi:hypothetical protein
MLSAFSRMRTCMRQHASEYASIRQHTLAYASGITAVKRDALGVLAHAHLSLGLYVRIICEVYIERL